MSAPAAERFSARTGRPDAVLLAAGFSSRFGGDKLLTPHGGKPLILHTLAALRAACGRSFDAVIPVYRDKPGHPVMAERSLVNRLLTMPDGGRLDEALYLARVCRVNTLYPQILEDVDTPEDLDF
ncbi:MAG: hypothetical protein E4H36_14410 [Spirochaetales bacterium]|nr:MAG: hypothetical protein E4H36_14410 [Spirochaetales bacterium]